MANEQINPYGNNGPLPSGISIVDNLVDGGRNKALSAEMGKELASMVGVRPETQVDISGISETTGIITANDGSIYGDKWSVSGYKCKLIPVTAGQLYCIKGGSSGACSCAVLTDNYVSNGNRPHWATGWLHALVVPKNGKVYVSIPSDGAYLYVSITNAPTIYLLGESDASKETSLTHDALYGPHIAKREIVVAASDAPAWQRKDADYQCTGTNDELTIQKAINLLSDTGGKIRLTAGTFYIDSFPKDRGANNAADYGYRYCAILLPQHSNVEFEIEGSGLPLTAGGTLIRVSDTCYEGLDGSNQYCILGTGLVAQITALVAMKLTNVGFALPMNRKPILCIDCFAISRVLVQYVTCRAYISGYQGTNYTIKNPPPDAAVGCAGLRSVGGSNWGTIADFKNVGVAYFYEGFALAGEHIVGINLSAITCHYGYTFGNFTFTGASTHPMTLINCCEEQCACGPYFNNCSGNQQVDLMAFNMEVNTQYISGGQRIQNATEKTPGQFRGRIDYTIWGGGSNKFWNAGHGHGFITRNMLHLPAVDTTTRNSYIPDYMERIYDTTLNKEVICVNEETKEWRDAMGNIV